MMAAPNVYFVHLRRPGPEDPRFDPYYEFGSFGCTKCHSRNLLHPRHAEELEGGRLAFIQGGHLGSRLVFLTPPIKVKVWRDSCEAKWQPAEMPFRYDDAPLLVSNAGESDIPSIIRLIKCGAPRCPTFESALSSIFRSRTTPLPTTIAREIVRLYRTRRKRLASVASRYQEALPHVTAVDTDRKRSYREFIDKRRTEMHDAGRHALDRRSKSRCGSIRRSSR